MRERDNDRLESFFKKVSGRPDISFSEEDWKKLEARLDAKETRASVARRNRNRIAGATVVAILLTASVYWLSRRNTEPAIAANSAGPEVQSAGTLPGIESLHPSTQSEGATVDEQEGLDARTADAREELRKNPAGTIGGVKRYDNLQKGERNTLLMSAASDADRSEATQLNIDDQNVESPESSAHFSLGPEVADSTDHNEFNDKSISPAFADKTKQKANIADSVREKNDVNVIDAYGSGLTEHPASPRLSLLLSIAPDFSTVAFDYYTDPGQAVGLLLYYHVKRSWSFSTGVVKTRKKYMGDGEDYTPPNGYWRNNTNGIIPETIDGTCNILEIPVMVHYAVINKGKNRLSIGAGASSYIMLDEAYQYNFEQPNPGAKKGWSSTKQSSLFFNAINVTAGFEHRILPGFMVGVEPYLKIPLEGIGWCDLKLYSAGASVTLRYIILHQKNPSTTNSGRARG